MLNTGQKFINDRICNDLYFITLSETESETNFKQKTSQMNKSSEWFKNESEGGQGARSIAVATSTLQRLLNKGMQPRPQHGVLQSQSYNCETKLLNSPIMKNDQEDVEAQRLKDEAQVAFSFALGQELDGIGYVASPGRSSTLAKDLNLSRTQSYRLLKGLSFPNLECLIAMRELGLSLDRILDQTSQRQPTTTNLRIDGKVIPVVMQPGTPNKATLLAAIQSDDGVLELRALLPGQSIPEGGIGIQSLRVPERHSIAIIDDDIETLKLLVADMSSAFYVAPFSSKSSFLDSPTGLTSYDAFLVDWRLPGVVGDELVKTIRRSTSAPIFILTGYADADDLIAKALDYPNVHHASKPVSAVILTKRISTAINC